MEEKNDNSVKENITETLNESNQDTYKKSSKSKKGIAIILVMAVILVIAATIWQLYEHFTLVGNVFGSHKLYSRNVSEVDLSGSDIADFSGLGRLQKVKRIDLTNTSIRDLSVLYDCKSLDTVILNGKDISAEECMKFYEELPHAQLKCNVIIGEASFDSQTTSAKFSGLSEDELNFITALHELKELDLTGCTVSDEKYDYLQSKLPECRIVRMLTFNGSEYSNEAKAIKFTSEISETETERLKYFISLESIDARACSNYEMLAAISEKYPEFRIERNIKVLDVTADSTVELLDLRGYKYNFDDVKSAFAQNLKYFSNIKKIDMCGCGLSNEQMEELCNEYPDIKFVWFVTFGRWKVRTDAVVFSTLNSNIEEEKIYDETTFAPVFKYCTDLVALDLGHNIIEDVSGIANLKKLRAVILTDNQIKDISAFAELKELEFMEMNASNRIQSVAPLKDLKNLKYINIYSSKAATDLSPLYSHENLEITLFHTSVPANERKRFRESNPNCQAFFWLDIGPNPEHPVTTNKEWRENPYRKTVKKAFTYWRYVVGYDEKNGYIYDWKTDQYKR